MHHVLLHVLLALAVVIIVGRLLGLVFRHLGQPPVIGEVVAGIVLGPSVLGALSPEAMAFLLPKDAAGHLGIIGQLGVIFYMFVVGLELNTGRLRSLARPVLAVSISSMVVPFGLGLAIAVWLYPTLAPTGVPTISFYLFVGISLAITAFPVLARILGDRKLDRTTLGLTALGAAAIGDVVAWCLLAVVVGVAQSNVESAIYVLGAAAGFVVVMLLVVRPLIGRYVRRHGDEPEQAGTLAVVAAGVLLSAVATEAAGVHAVFGAFLLGVLIPHDSGLADDVGRKLSAVVGVLLLPAFFAFTGLRTQIGLVSSSTEWLQCGAIVAVATAGKFGSAYAAARWTGIGHRDAAAVGALMNTRGLMELIVLNIGLDLGVISPTLFAMMVIMALVTTMTTGPALTWLGVGNEKGPATSVAGPSR